jgi:hypothetical protein
MNLIVTAFSIPGIFEADLSLLILYFICFAETVSLQSPGWKSRYSHLSAS